MKKSGLGRALVILLVIGVAAFSRFNKYQQQAAQRNLQSQVASSEARMAKLKLEAQRQLKENGEVDPKVEKEMLEISARLANSFASNANGLGGQEAMAAKGMGETMSHLLELRKKYDEATEAAIEALGLVGASPENIDERLASLAAYRKTCLEQVDEFKAIPEYARKRLLAAGLSSKDADQAASEFAKGFKAQLPTILAVRQADIDIVGEAEKIYLALKTCPGAYSWSAETGEIEWADDAPEEAIEALEAAAARIQELGEKQVEAQQALMRPR